MASSIAPGTTIANQFKLVRKLGEGGMGELYLAEQLDLGRMVAIKLVRDDLIARQPDMLERFHREARALARLNHPNVVHLHMFGQTAEGTPFFAMEYVVGRSLEAELLRVRMAPLRALRIAEQIASALAATHECGVVHRDLKPANVMLAESSRQADWVKLVDFGIAKTNSGEGMSKLTQAGAVYGTPAYMAPEQLRLGQADARSDVYALGLVLYEMLTGQALIQGATAYEQIFKQVGQQADPPSRSCAGLPASVDAVVLRCLEKEPELRLGSAAELELELARLARELEGGGPGDSRRVFAPSVPFGSATVPLPLLAESTTAGPSVAGRVVAEPLLPPPAPGRKDSRRLPPRRARESTPDPQWTPASTRPYLLKYSLPALVPVLLGLGILWGRHYPHAFTLLLRRVPIVKEWTSSSAMLEAPDGRDPYTRYADACFAFYVISAHDSCVNYARWAGVEPELKGGARPGAMLAVMDGGCAAAAELGTSDHELDSYARSLVAAGVPLMALTSEAASYYSAEHWKDDGLQRGRALHPQLLARYRRFSLEERGFRREMERRLRARSEAVAKDLVAHPDPLISALLGFREAVRGATRWANRPWREIARVEAADVEGQLRAVAAGIAALREQTRPGSGVAFDSSIESALRDAGGVVVQLRALRGQLQNTNALSSGSKLEGSAAAIVKGGNDVLVELNRSEAMKRNQLRDLPSMYPAACPDTGR